MNDPRKTGPDDLLVRLFRVWKRSREKGQFGCGPMHDLASQLALPANAAWVSASLFELVESELGRPLICGDCEAQEFSTDEVALLEIIHAAPALAATHGSSQVPHGLSAAIRWAAISVRRALGWPASGPLRGEENRSQATCPFVNDPRGASGLL